MYEQYYVEYRCCGTCKYKTLRIKEGMRIYTCNNKNSDNYAMEIEYKDSCLDWQEK